MDTQMSVLSVRQIALYCFIYAAFCALWILTTDPLIETFATDPAQLTRLQSVKGIACLWVIGVLLCLLLFRLRAQQAAAQAAANAAADQYRALFEESHTVMLLVAPEDGRILRANQAARDYYRRNADAMRDLPLTEISLTPPEDTLRLLAQAETDGQARFTAQHRMPNGHIRDVRVVAERVQLLDATAVCLTVSDVTEHKSLEAQLEESATWMRLYFELPFAGIGITAPDSKRYLRVNQRLCEMFGYPEAELCRMTWPELTHPDDLDADTRQFERLLAGEIDGYLIEKRFIGKDGVDIPTRLNVRCTRDPGGRVALCLASHQDLRQSANDPARSHATQ